MNKEELREMIRQQLNEGFKLAVITTFQELPADVSKLNAKDLSDEEMQIMAGGWRAAGIALKKKGIKL